MSEEKAHASSAHKDFVRELANLRARVDEVAELYGLGLKARTVAKVIQRMKKLSLKPLKGRVKDLKRIQDLVDALTETMQGSD